MSLIQRLKIKMSEEIVTKEVAEKPVESKNGSFLAGELDSLEKSLCFSEKSKLIQKNIEYIIETKEETGFRLERETTAINKKIWVDLFGKTMGSYAEINKRTETPKSTFYYWFNNDNQFREAIKNVKKNNQNDMEDILILKAKSGNMTALVKWLEANHPTYSKKLKVETYTGDKTYEDLIDQVNEELNNEDGNNKIEVGKESGSGNNDGREKETIEQATDTDNTEDKKQEGEDRPISA